MIKEAYCSKEVSILLKEKGFNESVHHEYHDTFLTPHFHKKSHNFNGYEYANCGTKWYSAPTHQMAMKWLRGKGIHMSIDTVISSSGNIYFNIDTYSEDSGWNHPVDFYNSYEEAVEAALKYTLKHLI